VNTMAKIDRAQAKWERNVAASQGKWTSGVQAAVSSGAYCKGVSEFLGTAASGEACSAYNEGVSAVSGAEWAASVTGKGAKWAANYRAAY
jgi:hypothetical protein